MKSSSHTLSLARQQKTVEDNRTSGRCRADHPSFRKNSVSAHAKKSSGICAAILQRPEMLVFLALMLLFSAPALSDSFSASMIFLPHAVQAGEWWRLLTHPFVHVTRYHLLLDGAAFLLLYGSLVEPSRGRRLAYVAAGGIGSLMASWTAAPAIAGSGLCGLSGIAHGLMAVSALEMIVSHPRGSTEHRLGWIVFGAVIGKAAFEAIIGHAALEFLHFGLMGEPVAVSHAGGVLGCLAVWLIAASTTSTQTACQPPHSSQRSGATT